MPVDLILGDVLEVVRGLPDESFTACFCDPPYGLKFMGKEWDHGVPSKEVWAEILRVLKPGAVLMTFGGTRTWHRLAVAIEDARFELFDTMMWLYGSGFPKSHSIGKALDKAAGRLLGRQSVVQLKRRLIALFDASGKTRSAIDIACGFRACNYLTLPKEGKRPDPWINILPSQEKWQRIKAVIGCDEAISAELDGLFAEAEREVVGQGTSGKTAIWNAEGTMGDFDLTASVTDAAKTWDGYGTALKPAWEPILLARKPRRATYAQTAMEHGTACLNIDECRVGTEVRVDSARRQDGPYTSERTWSVSKTPPRQEPKRYSGRWPANLLLSHSDCERVGVKRVKQRSGSVSGSEPSHTGDENTFCYGEYNRVAFQRYADPDGLETVAAYRCSPDCPAAMLDRQSGLRRSSHHINRSDSQKSSGGVQFASGKGYAIPGVNTYADTGGASRFFKTFERFYYCAKSSRRERDLGLPEGEHNSHPTVKSLRLCEYLARLIVPPEQYRDEAQLLTPFCGSGSEIIGALMAGWRNATGIDIVPEYLEIARLRIAAHTREPQQMTLGGNRG